MISSCASSSVWYMIRIMNTAVHFPFYNEPGYSIIRAGACTVPIWDHNIHHTPVTPECHHCSSFSAWHACNDLALQTFSCLDCVFSLHYVSFCTTLQIRDLWCALELAFDFARRGPQLLYFGRPREHSKRVPWIFSLEAFPLILGPGLLYHLNTCICRYWPSGKQAP